MRASRRRSSENCFREKHRFTAEARRGRRIAFTVGSWQTDRAMQRSDFGRLAEVLRRDYGAERIWLFGSHARGTADEASDVDLLVISPIVPTPEELEGRLRKGDQFFAGIVETGLEL